MQLQHVDPVHKVSIIPRGIGALGFTLQLPAQDRHLYTQQELLERIEVLLGGRAAEQIMFNDLSTGAADDLQKATEMARRLVVEFGMSECLGPMAVPVERSVFLAEVREKMGNVSDATAQKIDSEVQAILQKAYDSVSALLRGRKVALQQVADLLETKETVDGEEVKAILARADTATTL
jgi:cell division protease FtsH